LIDVVETAHTNRGTLTSTTSAQASKGPLGHFTASTQVLLKPP
jgi:hypothetical protein